MKTGIWKCCVLAAYMLILFSCTSSDVVRVHLKSELHHKVSACQLYSSVDVVPVFAASEDLIFGDKPLIWVSNDNLYVLSSDSLNISSFDTSGAYKWTLRNDRKVLDFSTYKDSLLMVLCEANHVEEYSIVDRKKLLQEDNPEITTSIRIIVRNKDGVYWYAGCTRNSLYDGCCYQEGKLIDGVRNPIACSDDLNGNRYCRCNETVYYNYYTNGMVLVFTEDDFIIPYIEWDFGKYTYNRQALQTGKADLEDFATSFSNLQIGGSEYPIIYGNYEINSGCCYMTFKWNGKDLLLIYDAENRESRVIEKTREGFVFPLGIIDNGINYFVCKPADLGKYLDMSKLDTSRYADADCLLLKYHLK